MGFTIFESSGTFNPLDYGLSVGDLIHILAVGGGGGGCGTANLYIAGTAGSASSFGNILVAEGGLSPIDNNSVTPQTGSFRGATGFVGGLSYMHTSTSSTTVEFTHERSSYAGNGADGWLPGICKGRSGLSTLLVTERYIPVKGHSISRIIQDFQGRTNNLAFRSGLLTAIPASNQIAGSGGIYVDDTSTASLIAIGGAGGIGYGAGGGGGAVADYSNYRAGAGGNSGVIAQKDYVLTSSDMKAIAVTVGTGGAGGSGYAGGAGANGCVAIFW